MTAAGAGTIPLAETSMQGQTAAAHRRGQGARTGLGTSIEDLISRFYHCTPGYMLGILWPLYAYCPVIFICQTVCALPPCVIS